MVLSEAIPLVVNESAMPTHRKPAGKNVFGKYAIIAVCASFLVVASLNFLRSHSDKILEESSVQLFKNALASQEADLAKHRAKESRMKTYAIKSGQMIDGFHSKRERISDAKLFKVALKEQHDELKRQRDAEANAKAAVQGQSGSGKTKQMSDASLLKDALKEQHLENKSVAKARMKIQAAAKILNQKLQAERRLKASEEAAKKKRETSDERLFQDALKSQQDDNRRENIALKKDLIIAAKKTKDQWSKSKAKRHAKIEHELSQILGGPAQQHTKIQPLKKPKLLKEAMAEQEEDREKAARAQAKKEAQTAAIQHKEAPKRFTATQAGHQVLSQAAEKTLVAFLTRADQLDRHKLSPDQEALGQELRRARAAKAKPAARPHHPAA